MTTATVPAFGVAALTGGSALATAPGVAVASLVILGTVAIVPGASLATLAYLAPCATQRCQLWKITRRDGVVLAFTSLDVDYFWAGVTYKSCASLTPTASESSTSLGDVGSIAASGVIDDAALSEADLYAGLYHDAFVKVWLVSWGGGDAGVPARIAAGWCGTSQQGEVGYTIEVVGPGARLAQASLVDFYSPGCRWNFGDSECGVDAEALKLAGETVTAVGDRLSFASTITAPGGSTIWNGGTVRWLTGANAGVSCEVDTVNFGAATIDLWAPAPFEPAIGDTFDLLPGCPRDKPSCVLYGNLINFGGFPDVPGTDAITQTPDVPTG